MGWDTLIDHFLSRAILLPVRHAFDKTACVCLWERTCVCAGNTLLLAENMTDLKHHRMGSFFFFFPPQNTKCWTLKFRGYIDGGFVFMLICLFVAAAVLCTSFLSHTCSCWSLKANNRLPGSLALRWEQNITSQINRPALPLPYRLSVCPHHCLSQALFPYKQ